MHTRSYLLLEFISTIRNINIFIYRNKGFMLTSNAFYKVYDFGLSKYKFD